MNDIPQYLTTAEVVELREFLERFMALDGFTPSNMATEDAFREAIQRAAPALLLAAELLPQMAEALDRFLWDTDDRCDADFSAAAKILARYRALMPPTEDQP